MAPALSQMLQKSVEYSRVLLTMPRLNTLGARVTTLDTRTVKPQPKQADPHYLSPQHRAWRARSDCSRDRGSEISTRDRGAEPPGVSRTDFFLGPEKIGIRKWVFPVRDEKSNLPAAAVERQAISYWRTA